MPDMLYVGVQDDDRIAVFALERDNGERRGPRTPCGDRPPLQCPPEYDFRFNGWRGLGEMV